MSFRSAGAVAAIIIPTLLAPNLAAARRQPCPDAEYVLQGAPLVSGAASTPNGGDRVSHCMRHPE